MDALFLQLGSLLNESLSATIAIIAGSFFLYSVVKDINNRVARAFSALLFFVTVTYIGDLGVSFSGNSLVSAERWLRFQWLGIAFTPAAYVNLSDAILAMTGLESRGRRRAGVRFLYIMATIFFVLTATTDLIVADPVLEPAPHFHPGPVFWLFMVYFVSSVVLSLWFVIRARRRTLTSETRRRFTYLLLTYAAPAIGVFPFLLVSGNAALSPALFYASLMVADVILAVMLTFMSYTMAFFGSLLPDRLIKSQMLQYFLRGPVVAIATLGVIVWVPRAGAVLGLPGDEVMPFLAVTTILFLQWTITILRPRLEDLLIYAGEQREIRQIRQLEERLLTGSDFTQLLDSILAALCDYLRVESAFVASVTAQGPHFERAVGLHETFEDELEDAQELTVGADNLPKPAIDGAEIFEWQGFWLIPLFAQRTGEINGDEPELIGLLGTATPKESITPENEERWQVLMALATRAAEVLEDRRLQQGVFQAFEGMLPEVASLRRLRRAARYGRVEELTDDQFMESPDFVQRIKDALGQYWGGPKLIDNSLLSMAVVRKALDGNEGNAQRAMRAVLQQAIENLRPEGQRSMTTTEWILYNILEMRFIQGRKVREVAMRLAMSESDLYRKQRVAIESVASIIAELERLAAESGSASDGPVASEPQAKTKAK